MRAVAAEHQRVAVVRLSRRYSAPVIALAPGRFSTVNDLPSFALRLVASTRAMMSVPLPAASGTTMVTLRLG